MPHTFLKKIGLIKRSSQEGKWEFAGNIAVMVIIAVIAVVTIGLSVWELQKQNAALLTTRATLNELEEQNQQLSSEINQINSEYIVLKQDDQFVRNENLSATISAIEKTYAKATTTYEDVIKLRERGAKTQKTEEQLAKVFAALSKQDYLQGEAVLAEVAKSIATLEAELAASTGPAAFVIAATVPESSAPPANGYQRQKVTTSFGSYQVDVVAGDLGSTRVIVDTASDGTCGNDCPVLSLADYVSRNGGYAGVNGSYFCPASYPSCAGKTNSFDTLLMNKNKVYFNSDNNVYSRVPAVIFGSGYVRFVGASQDWGRDTGIDSMIANQPLLVSGGNSVFGGDGDPKKTGAANRPFVANKGNTVYIGVVYRASVQEAAGVLAAMGMENALNLDSGGSTALWAGGYKTGPGRAIPNAIVFVRK